MAPEHAALIAEADAAVKARAEARQANREFRDQGQRRQWMDRLNAARKEVYGALSTLPPLERKRAAVKARLASSEG